MYGSPEYDPLKDQYKCELCGLWFDSIPNHLKKHNISPKEYKEMFGFAQSTSLISDMLLYRYQRRAKDEDAYSRISEYTKENEFKKGNKMAEGPRAEEVRRFLKSISPLGARKVKVMAATRRKVKEQIKKKNKLLKKKK